MPPSIIFNNLNFSYGTQVKIEKLYFSALPKEKICESSPIELQISPYGQWTMTPPRDRTELQPPLFSDNPLMIPIEQLTARGSLTCSNSRTRTNRTEQTRNQPAMEAGEVWNNQSTTIGGSGSEDSDKWLSQVEIVTHVGPHRRLWMGPQFCFKTFKPAKNGLKMECVIFYLLAYFVILELQYY